MGIQITEECILSGVFSEDKFILSGVFSVDEFILSRVFSVQVKFIISWVVSVKRNLYFQGYAV